MPPPRATALEKHHAAECARYEVRWAVFTSRTDLMSSLTPSRLKRQLPPLLDKGQSQATCPAYQAGRTPPTLLLAATRWTTGPGNRSSHDRQAGHLYSGQQSIPRQTSHTQQGQSILLLVIGEWQPSPESTLLPSRQTGDPDHKPPVVYHTCPPAEAKGHREAAHGTNCATVCTGAFLLCHCWMSLLCWGQEAGDYS